MLVALCGRSGSGKTTVAKRLAQNLALKSVTSYTTREPRHRGEQGYIFVTDEQFDALNDKIAVGEYGGARYCATPELLRSADIYIVEPTGLPDVRAIIPREDLCVVMLDISEDVSRARLIARGDKMSDVESRLAQDAEWFNVDDIRPDVVINANGPLELVCTQIAMLIRADDQD